MNESNYISKILMELQETFYPYIGNAELIHYVRMEEMEVRENVFKDVIQFNIKNFEQDFPNTFLFLINLFKGLTPELQGVVNDEGYVELAWMKEHYKYIVQSWKSDVRTKD